VLLQVAAGGDVFSVAAVADVSGRSRGIKENYFLIPLRKVFVVAELARLRRAN
jgi:hypothetical protein